METVNNSNISENGKFMRPLMDYALKQYETKRVAVYARVSREGELKHQSIESQMENLKDYIASNPDWEFAGFYVDEGITGTKLNRPEFNRMMQDARSGNIDIILTKTVSRFGRNTAAVLKTLQELKSLGITVVFDSNNISTDDPNCLIRLQYESIMAEHVAKQNSENMKWAIRNRFEEGIPNNMQIYGYRMVNHQLQVMPEEAEIVRIIFELYLAGMGRQAIAKKLNEEKIPSFTGGLWSLTSISHILCNEKYTGDMLLQKWYVPDFITKTAVLNRGDLPQFLVSDSHEAIVDRTTFERVQKEIARRETQFWTCHNNDSSQRGAKLMSQLVRCGHCGKSIYYKLSHGSSKRKLWVCKTHIEQGAIYCPIKPIREDILIDTTREVLLTENLIKDSTTLTNDLLKQLIQVIIAKDNQELEYHLMNGKIIAKAWQYESRSKSWTPEMKQKARERALAQHAKRKEANHESK